MHYLPFLFSTEYSLYEECLIWYIISIPRFEDKISNGTHLKCTLFRLVLEKMFHVKHSTNKRKICKILFILSCNLLYLISGLIQQNNTERAEIFYKKLHSF